MAGINIIAPPLSSITGLGSGVVTALAIALNAAGGLAPVTSPVFTGPTLGVATYTSLSGGNITVTGAVGINITPAANVDLDVTNLGTSHFARIGRSATQYIQFSGNSSEDTIINTGVKAFRIGAGAGQQLQLSSNSTFTSFIIHTSGLLALGVGAGVPTHQAQITPSSGAPQGLTFKVQDGVATTGATGTLWLEGQGQSTFSMFTLGDATNANRVGFTFNASNILEINTGVKGTFADLKLRTLIADATVRFKGYTVATLPAGTIGDNAYVTDALAPTFLATVVGGGAIVTPVFYNGSAWVGA